MTHGSADTLQPERSGRRKSWRSRHKVRTGFAAFGAVIVIGGIASAGCGSPSKSGDCSAQAKAWLSRSLPRTTKLETDLHALGKAVGTLANDMSGGTKPAGDVSAVRTAAAALLSQAKAVEADPAPSCVPGQRANLNAALADYSKGAIDYTKGLSAGNEAVAVADMYRASAVTSQADAKYGASISDLKAFNASHGG